MSRIASLSIRTILGLVTAVMSLLIVTLSVAALVDGIERNSNAHRVAALTSTSRVMFKTLLATRLERGTQIGGLAAEAPSDTAAETRVADNRRISEDGYAEAVAALGGVTLPELPPVLAQLKSAHDAFATLRPKIDAAMRQAKPARDTEVVRDFPRIALAYLDAITATSDLLEASLKMVDPMVDQLLSVKRAAWAVRNYAGLVALRIETAAASGQPWGPAELVGAAEDRGRAALAWTMVNEAAKRSDAPKPLVEAVAKANQSLASPMAAQQKAIVEALSTGQKVTTPLSDLQKLTTALLSFYVDVVNRALDEMVARADRQMSSATHSLIVNGLTLFAALAFTASGFVIVGRRVSRPIRMMSASMRGLAAHDLTVEIPGIGRGDEIGQMAEAVQVFKDSIIETDRLNAEQERQRAEQERRTKHLTALTREFDDQVAGLLQTVSSAATELQSTAQSMSATAEETNRQSTAVAAASEQTSVNVQTVATATEELTASISEISRQVAQSTQIAQKAVGEANQTTEQVKSLEEAAQKIGKVVQLINDIASQTNLLALNATIEAARAGEAGKGFAVVASEVKALATQTAKATEEIGLQIAGMQQATGLTVAAIDHIRGTISEISQIATTIASAIEEQGAATQEIARNVQQAAQGTHEVASNITGVTRAASETGAGSSQVLGAANELSKQSETLRAEVDRFLADVRAA